MRRKTLEEVKACMENIDGQISRAQDFEQTSWDKLPRLALENAHSSSGAKFGSFQPEDNEVEDEEIISVPLSPVNQSILPTSRSKDVEDSAIEDPKATTPKLFAIKAEREDKQTTVIMGQLKKFVSKDITTTLELLKLATTASHEVDLAKFVHVENLIEDDDSPIATSADTMGERKRDKMDDLIDETLEATQARATLPPPLPLLVPEPTVDAVMTTETDTLKATSLRDVHRT
ncbi:hypothetical protein K7X08_006206 [Anisodus acutangulus]|uniref:Uncharacterized protein n=1 Tax=Anisodus acutangulus TaxID=402998 RepID=A0A9Q1MUW4_9SOLA|nr:hypothetical protein K7X08_006206 [Anisodus acutangulus]